MDKGVHSLSQSNLSKSDSNHYLLTYLHNAFLLFTVWHRRYFWLQANALQYPPSVYKFIEKVSSNKTFQTVQRSPPRGQRPKLRRNVYIRGNATGIYWTFRVSTYPLETFRKRFAKTRPNEVCVALYLSHCWVIAIIGQGYLTKSFTFGKF